MKGRVGVTAFSVHLAYTVVLPFSFTEVTFWVRASSLYQPAKV